MKRLAILFLLIFITNCAGVITGLVIDERGLPVKGAIVQTNPPTNSVITSEEGYKINDVPPGVYTVTATKKGYSEGAATVKVKNNKVTTADIQIFKLTE